jgi:hypothetical protein
MITDLLFHFNGPLFLYFHTLFFHIFTFYTFASRSTLSSGIVAIAIFLEAVAFLALALRYLRVHSVQEKSFSVAARYTDTFTCAG